MVNHSWLVSAPSVLIALGLPCPAFARHSLHRYGDQQREERAAVTNQNLMLQDSLVRIPVDAER